MLAGHILVASGGSQSSESQKRSWSIVHCPLRPNYRMTGKSARAKDSLTKSTFHPAEFKLAACMRQADIMVAVPTDSGANGYGNIA